MDKILVLATHPDDETLGCGGYLLKKKKEGHKIYWLIITGLSETVGYSKAMCEKREKEIEAVSQAYNFDKTFNLKFDTTKLDTYPLGELVKKIGNVITEVEASHLFLPFHSDAHSDHRITFDAGYSCTKSFRYPSLRKVYMMETLSETEYAPAISGQTFIPNTFVDISDFFQEKVKVMNIYESEIAKHPFPRSEETLEALAKYRGSTINVKYAESFVLLKDIIK